MTKYINHRLPLRAVWGIALAMGMAFAQDEDLKEGRETPRYPDYTYEEEVPRHTMTVPGSSSGMFFERHAFGDPFMGRWQASYTNYGWKDYENYRLNTTPFLRTYDTFGSFIADGYEVFTLEEYRTRAPEVGSLERKGQFYQNWLRHLIIADDAYGGWSTRLMVGDFIHTTFTPLTLDMSVFNGVRFDAISTGTNQLTLIASRISDPLKISITGRTDFGRQGIRENVDDGAYLIGGHWESNIGQAFTFGASYVNLYRFDAQRGFKTNSLKGLAPPNAVPQEIIVRFEDDSPGDGRGGAAVFDLVANLTLAPTVDQPDAEETVVVLRPVAVESSPGVVTRGRHLEANGFFRDQEGIDNPVYIDYTFEVPETATNLEFAALVANDYKISMRQKHFFVTDPVRGSGENRETQFSLIRRAESNVIDMSNKQIVRFDYGLATGVQLMGINARVSIPGLEIHGEIVTSDNHYQYPTVLGKRSKFDDYAGYLTINKEWSHAQVGGELFRIGPKFTSYNPHPAAADPPLGEEFFFNTPRQQFYRGRGVLTNTPYYGLVDDNDNMLYNEFPDNWLASGRTPEEGDIFPFFDLDQDGHQDTNRNRNSFADYDEPFLMYFTEPEEFYFGDDYNNNFIVDAWEDDSLPNYPYYKDEGGTHFLAGVSPLRELDLTVGRYSVDQIAADGRNQVVYGRVDFERRYADLRLRLSWNHESKDVKDDIPNDYFRFLLREAIGGYTQTFFNDRLEARDSFINRGQVKVYYQPLDDWNMETRLRYELNSQRATDIADGGFQLDDDLNFYGFVFRTDYVRRWGRLTVMPRFKFLYQLRDRASLDDPTIESLQAFPILRADYQVTARSQLRVGLQGLPLLVDRRRDFVNSANDSDRFSWTVMWFSESEYEGYRIGTEVGILRREVDFDDPEQPDTEFTRFFVRMVSAVGGVVR